MPRFLIMGCLLLALGALVASVASVLLVQGMEAAGGSFQKLLVDHGPDKVARRCLLVVYVAIIAFLLRKCGWRGVRDLGLRTDDPELYGSRGPRSFLSGLVVGVISMIAVSLILLFCSPRFMLPSEGMTMLLKRIFEFALSGIVVALIEETVCRGMFFRPLSRSWGFWPAAVVTSALFASGHFLSPEASAFSGGSFLERVWNVYSSTFVAGFAGHAVVFRFFNLTLLGMTLCALVFRTGTIWFGVGAHAGWVWVIKTFYYLTHLENSAPVSAFIGRRADAMDSPLASLVMAGVIAWAMLGERRHGVQLNRNSVKWRVVPDRLGRVDSWLSERGNNEPEPGNVLKEYRGCRVSRTDGMVLKEYRPRSFLNGVRFAFKSSRVKRAFVLGRRLVAAGVPVPLQIAWGQKKTIGIRQAEFLLTDEIGGCFPLDVLLGEKACRGCDEGAVLREYASLMASFHANGFSNRDLKDENVLVDVHGGKCRMWAVDLDGVRHVRYVTRRRAGRDLFRVGQSLLSKGRLSGAATETFFEKYNSRLPRRLHFSSFPGAPEPS